jgi:hypothetical protein
MSGARETRPRPREPAPPHALKEGGDLQGAGHQGRERSSMPEVADSAHTERGFGAVGEENKRERGKRRETREGYVEIGLCAWTCLSLSDMELLLRLCRRADSIPWHRVRLGSLELLLSL